MYPSKETLSAFIDGELDPTERARVAALVDSDQKLKAFVADQDALRSALQAAFAGTISEPIPDRLLKAVAETPISFRVRMSEWLGARPDVARGGVIGRFAIPALTMALGLVVGVGIERNATSTSDFSVSRVSGAVVAHAELARTLDQRLASEQQQGPMRVGVTFRNRSGALCRSFEVSRDSGTTDGFACRADGDWRIGAVVSRPPAATSSTYALAGSSMPDAIRDAISAHIKGAPLDAAAERHARDGGWN